MENCGEGKAALARLMAGNKAFLEGRCPVATGRAEVARLYTQGQRPCAAVLCCADSRITPELIFCQGLGQLFSVRTAGNVVSDLELGSVEYAVTELGARLVLVLGHSGCGAVAGALDGHGAGCMARVLEQIAPSVRRAREQAASPDRVAGLAEDFNIRNTLKLLRDDPALAGVQDLVFAAAKYDTHTGEVHILESGVAGVWQEPSQGDALSQIVKSV
ncbi:carbonic anhydrase [Intestinibacillus massiliensis]|nr:carbonic anhydrase [Intestinibacillus massiliensis]